MPASVVDTLQRMGTALIVVPVALLGVNFLIAGQYTSGGVFLALAALMIAISEYVKQPTDVPGGAVKRIAGWVAKPPDDEE